MHSEAQIQTKEHWRMKGRELLCPYTMSPVCARIVVEENMLSEIETA